MTTPRLYIGIETTVRELDAKLLLACVAAEAGFEVWMGQQKMFLRQLETMPQGILFNKSISPSKARKYAHYKRLGFPLVAYDEEGLAPFNADEYQKRRVNVDSLRALDYFFAWGEWQKTVIGQKAPDALRHVVTVGHPRVDLTRRTIRGFYADQVRALRERYGAFVLINTNFSFYNHFKGRDIEAFLRLKTKAGKVVDEEQRNYYRRISEHKKTLFYAFADLVVKIRTRFPELSVVLRPHPSEDHDYWRSTLPDDPNIHVVHEGTVLPWIMASTVMIHNSCTTGIEGYLLEQPVIAYRPVQNDELDIFLPNALSAEALNDETLLNLVEQLMSHDALPPEFEQSAEKKAIAEQYITGLDGPLSCERIVEYLKQIQFPARTLTSMPYHAYSRLKRANAAIRQQIRRIVQSKPTNAARQQYVRQKFPGLDLENVRGLVKQFHQATGRFAELHVSQPEADLLQISHEG